MIIEEIQTILDQALLPLNIRSYWNRNGSDNQKEYIIYLINGDSSNFHADNKPLAIEEDVTIKYYYDQSLISDIEGKRKVFANAELIRKTLEDNGFNAPDGIMWLGRIDEANVEVCVLELERTRVAND